MHDPYQDPQLPPGYREELDEIQEETTSMEEKLEDLTTCEHGLKYCNICDK